jgi:hypothetical protein
MEHASCNVIYVDRTIGKDIFVRASATDSGMDDMEWESAHVAENVKLLLNVFGEGMLPPPFPLLPSCKHDVGRWANSRVQSICAAPVVHA